MPLLFGENLLKNSSFEIPREQYYQLPENWILMHKSGNIATGNIDSSNSVQGSNSVILRNTEQEHTLLINEAGEYELAAYDKIENAFGGDKSVSAFVFERAGKTYVTLWHTADKCDISLEIDASSAVYEKDIGKEALPFEYKDGKLTLTAENKAYLSFDLPKETVISAFENGKIM